MRVQVLQRMRSAKRGKPLLPLAISLSLLGGCSTEDRSPVPVACKEGPDSVSAALARAPARVELDGTALSECFTRGADAADLQQVGASYVAVAARLAAAARERPDGREALQLGYLVGASRRGEARTQGIHHDLMRRIEQELSGVDTASAAYRRGFRAGRDHG
ncbi:MAG TPA: hypothetical protein VHF45_03580 [Thermoleophilaceae bacterium]|nr:hypothetical protein [Thermoleophilaceae bacterium]